MRVIGLDLGTKTGVAWTDSGRVDPLFSYVWDISNEDRGKRWINFRRLLRELIAKAPGEALVFYENAAFQRGHAAHCFSAMVSVIEEEGCRFGVKHEGIPVSHVKKRATGRGNATKECMVEAAEKEWDMKVVDHNHADALWILQCGLDKLESS